MKKAPSFTTILVIALILTGIAQAQTKTFQFMFVNRTDMQLHFYVDDSYVCTANAGMVCYSTVAVGPHNFKAKQGSMLIREAEGTLYEDAGSPQWVVCYNETGICE